VVLLSSFILYAALCCRCHVRANAQLPHMNIWESGTDSVRIVTAKLEANKIYKKQRGLLEVFVLKRVGMRGEGVGYIIVIIHEQWIEK